MTEAKCVGDAPQLGEKKNRLHKGGTLRNRGELAKVSGDLVTLVEHASTWDSIEEVDHPCALVGSRHLQSVPLVWARPVAANVPGGLWWVTNLIVHLRGCLKISSVFGGVALG